MESIIIKKVRIVDPNSTHNGQRCDVLIVEGNIVEIASDLKTPDDADVWEAEGAAISPGWVDLQAHFYDPGAEHKEGLKNGALAASHGGFTRVILNANSLAHPDNKSAVSFLQAQTEDFTCRLHPMACVSQQGAGMALSEMHDLARAGAVAFSDDQPIDRTEMLRRALEYGSTLVQPVLSLPLDLGLNAGAMMHEGDTSTHMGVTGNPSASEVMRIQRDLQIAKYTGGRLHFPVVSAAESVDLIRSAKSEGMNITCGTTANHLRFIDEDLSDFDGTLKVMPPFRGAADREALRQGVIDGTIDAVVSDHRPEDLEHHDVEFSLSSFGIAGIESAFAIAHRALKGTSKGDSLSALVRALSTGPRHVLGLEQPSIMPGQKAELTWFHPEQPWKDSSITKGTNKVQSTENQTDKLIGNPLGTVCGMKGFRRD